MTGQVLTMIPVVLTGLLQASLAARSVITQVVNETAGCEYTYLAQAKVSLTKSFLGVQFCNTKQALSANGVSDVFAGVEWLDHTLEGRALSSADEGYINKYTGSYKWAKNVGAVFRGIIPSYPRWEPMDEQYWNVKTRQYDALVKNVLNFGIGLGTALNKIPSPTSAITVWRGGWESKQKLADYQHLSSNSQILQNSWFQSTTVNERHSYNFLHPQYEPSYCKPKCQEEGKEFPVHFEYTTRVVKDVRKYNEAEAEMIIMPNSPFYVTGIQLVNNDPLEGLDNAGLCGWLAARLEQGPSLQQFLAAIQKDQKMNGSLFAKLFRTNYLYWTSQRYHLDAPSGAYQNLKTRFILPPFKDVIANDSPYYYKVTLTDP